MKEVTINIPVHEVNDEFIGNALRSVSEQKILSTEVLLVHPKSVVIKDELISDNIKSITRSVVNEGKTDFASQFNLGVSESKTEWVSLLEMDDLLSTIWLDNFQKYAIEHEDVSLFLPIVAEVNAKREFTDLNNQLPWSQGFTDLAPIGYLDTASLLDYPNFNFAGMIVKKEIFESLNGIKPSLKLVFMYEFLLRFTHNNHKIFIIPKIGYQHINFREGSLFSTYRDEMNPVENSWWYKKAKQEYFFNDDREISYDA